MGIGDTDPEPGAVQLTIKGEAWLAISIGERKSPRYACQGLLQLRSLYDQLIFMAYIEAGFR